MVFSPIMYNRLLDESGSPIFSKKDIENE